MAQTRTLRLVPLVALACSAGGCLEAEPRGSLEVHLVGPAYPRPRCAKGPAELGPIRPLGEPVAGARVELWPGGMTASSDSEGRALFEGLAEDTYEIKVSASGFAPADGTAMVRGAQKAAVRLGLDPCVSAGSDRRRVGFDTPVQLAAKTTCGKAWEGASFTWKLLEGPEIADSVKSWEGPLLSFRTRTLEEVRGPLPDEGQVLSFSPDQAGEYVFEVTARSRTGELARDTVLVTSTNPTGGMNSVPTHDVQYFLAPNRQGPWRWKLVAQPRGWDVRLGGADTRTPFVEAIPYGNSEEHDVTLLDEVSGTQFSLVLAGWNDVPRDCGRAGCHTGLQQSWEKTRHGSTWRKLVDGELISERGPAAESCAACHALGWDPSVKNGGYDDGAADPRVRFPEVPRAGTYAAMPESLQNVSNVFCLGCHGPARVDPPVAEQLGRFSAGVCARCHDRQPEQDLVAQWRSSKMSRTIKGDLNGAEQRRECSRCHTAQGVYYTNFAMGRPPSGDVVQLRCCDNLEPITCQACHSPMYARNPAQVFRYGAVHTGSGLALKEVGAAALCVTCHSTDHDTRRADTLERRLAPHSPQAELNYGHGGYAMELPAGAPALPPLEGVACARTAGQGCVTCHMDKGPGPGQPGYRQVGDHTFRMTSSDGLLNTRPCEACHPGRTSFDPRARGDFDGDGVVRSVREEWRGLMALLRARLEAELRDRGYRGCDPARRPASWFKAGDGLRLVLVDAEGFDLGDCDRNGFIEREEKPFLLPDPTLYQAAYNYLFLELDGSQGLHNLPYAIKLLQRTLVSLSRGMNLPGWEVYR